MTPANTFTVGDRVRADRALYDTFDDDYVVTGFEESLIGMDLVVVTSVDGKSTTCFYPTELSLREEEK